MLEWGTTAPTGVRILTDVPADPAAWVAADSTPTPAPAAPAVQSERAVLYEGLHRWILRDACADLWLAFEYLVLPELPAPELIPASGLFTAAVEITAAVWPPFASPEWRLLAPADNTASPDFVSAPSLRLDIDQHTLIEARFRDVWGNLGPATAGEYQLRITEPELLSFTQNAPSRFPVFAVQFDRAMDLTVRRLPQAVRWAEGSADLVLFWTSDRAATVLPDRLLPLGIRPVADLAQLRGLLGARLYDPRRQSALTVETGVAAADRATGVIVLSGQSAVTGDAPWTIEARLDPIPDAEPSWQVGLYDAATAVTVRPPQAGLAVTAVAAGEGRWQLTLSHATTPRFSDTRLALLATQPGRLWISHEGISLIRQSAPAATTGPLQVTLDARGSSGPGGHWWGLNHGSPAHPAALTAQAVVTDAAATTVFSVAGRHAPFAAGRIVAWPWPATAPSPQTPFTWALMLPTTPVDLWQRPLPATDIAGIRTAKADAPSTMPVWSRPANGRGPIRGYRTLTRLTVPVPGLPVPAARLRDPVTGLEVPGLAVVETSVPEHPGAIGARTAAPRTWSSWEVRLEGWPGVLPNVAWALDIYWPDSSHPPLQHNLYAGEADPQLAGRPMPAGFVVSRSDGWRVGRPQLALTAPADAVALSATPAGMDAVPVALSTSDGGESWDRGESPRDWWLGDPDHAGALTAAVLVDLTMTVDGLHWSRRAHALPASAAAQLAEPAAGAAPPTDTAVTFVWHWPDPAAIDDAYLLIFSGDAPTADRILWSAAAATSLTLDPADLPAAAVLHWAVLGVRSGGPPHDPFDSWGAWESAVPGELRPLLRP